MGTRMVLLDYIWPVESIGVGFIIIRPPPDDPKMAPWGTKYCMGIRDDGTTKWFQVHSIWVLWATFYLQTQKLFIQNVWLNCILEIVPWLCKILHDSSTVLFTVLHISKENIKEEKFGFVWVCCCAYCTALVCLLILLLLKYASTRPGECLESMWYSSSPKVDRYHMILLHASCNRCVLTHGSTHSYRNLLADSYLHSTTGANEGLSRLESLLLSKSVTALG